MKKLLALVLALVMTLSLCITSNAAFTDADSINNKEAVDVMSAIGVLAGMDNGSFNPAGTLTREQGAKIITYMLLGPTAADALVAPKAPFSDVAADRWSAGSIAYCVSEGIIAGVGNGKFDPTGSLTGYAFAKMCLVALGYRADMEGLTGADWSLNTATMIRKLDLANGISAFVGSNTMTREAAAQMGFNTLTSTEVYYDTTSSISSNGTSSIGTKTRSTPVSNAAAKDYRTVAGDQDTNMQLIEDVFPKLKLTTTTDSEGRPVNKWVFGIKTVSSESNSTPVVTYTGSTKKATIEKDLSGYSVNGFVPEINGFSATSVADTTISALAGHLASGQSYSTADGRIVEVYANSDNEITRVVALDQYFAKITAKDTVNKSVTLTIYTGPTTSAKFTVKSTGDNSDFYEELYAMSKNDTLLVYAEDSAAGTKVATGDTGNVIIKLLGEPDVVTGNCTATSVSSGVTTYTVAGKGYKMSNVLGTNATAPAVGDGNDYDVYLNQNGYVVYFGTATAARNYALVLDTDRSGSSKDGYTYEAKLLFTDGKVEWVTVGSFNGKDTASAMSNGYSEINAKSAANDKSCFVTYNVKDGEYDLIPYNSDDDATLVFRATNVANIKKNMTATVSAQAVNNNTIFLVKDGDTYTKYQGLSTLPSNSMTGAVVYTMATAAGSSIARIVVVDGFETVKNDVVFVWSTGLASSGSAEDGTTIYNLKALVDGEDTTIASKAATTMLTSGTTPAPGIYYKNTYKDEYVKTSVTKDDATNMTAKVAGTATGSLTSGISAKTVYKVTAADSITVKVDGGVMTIYDTTAGSGTAMTIMTNTNYNVFWYNSADNFGAGSITEVNLTSTATELTNAGATTDASVMYLVTDSNGYLDYAIVVSAAVLG